MLHVVKPAALGARRASVFVNFWQVSGAEGNTSQFSRKGIRAELRAAGFRPVDVGVAS
jgi:hypothetical protein